MTLYLSVAQDKTEDASDTGTDSDKTDDSTGVTGKRTDISTFAGTRVDQLAIPAYHTYSS